MKKMHYAWAVLAGCCALVFGIGLTVNVIGQYFVPVTAELGLGMGKFTFYHALRGVCLVASTAMLNKWLEKVEIRLLLSGCFIIQLLCTALMGTFTAFWQWYIAGAVMGFFLSPVYFQIPPIILSNWFVKKRGLVIGIAVAFSGIGGAIMNPIIAHIIEIYGWRFAYLANAIIAGVVVLPFLMFVIRLKPSDMGLKPYGYEEQMAQAQDGSAAAEKNAAMVKGVMREDILRSPSFVIMIVLFAAAGFFSGYPQYLTAYGITIGYAATLSSFLLSLSMVGNALTKLILGYICDKFGGKVMIFIAYSLVLISLVLLIIGTRSMPALLVGSFLAGTYYSVSTVGTPLFIQTVYGSRDYAKIYVLLSLSQNFFISFGPSIVGFMYDFSGGYSLPFMVGIFIVAAAVFLAISSIKTSKKLTWS